MLNIENIVLDFKPSLMDIARKNKDYELGKLIVNSNSFSQQLATIQSN